MYRALMHQELVMAAKNEERRQSELRKRKQYQTTPQKSPASSSAVAKKPQLQTQSSNRANQPKQSSSDYHRKHYDKASHHSCDHDCRRQIRSESTGNGSSSNKSSGPSDRANTKQFKPPSILSQDPKYKILCHYFIRPWTRVITFKRLESEMKVVIHIMVLVQGVLSQGIIVDSGADVTIMGASQVVAANRSRNAIPMTRKCLFSMGT